MDKTFSQLLAEAQQKQTSGNAGLFTSGEDNPGFSGLLQEANKGKFQRSLDADTIDLSRGKIRTPTRLAGIDAPESSQELGPYAHAYLDQLIGDSKDIKVGRISKDRHGRDVGSIYANGKHVSPSLVRMGLAKVYDDYLSSVTPEEAAELQEAQKQAQTRKIGVWNPKYAGMDADEYRKQLGSEKAYLGHDNRDPVDKDTFTVKDAYRKLVSEGRISDDLNLGSKVKKVNQPMWDKYRHQSEEGLIESAIKNKDRYVKEEGWLDHVFGALDYAGNISRSAIKGALDKDGSVLDYAKQAALKERRTSAEGLKDSITEKLGLGKLRMGEDDGEFQVGDIGDFVADVAVDIATDPLTWLTAGFSSAAKGGKVAKVLPDVHKGAVDAKMGILSDNAIKYAKAKMASNAAIGAVYGMGATDSDDEWTEKLLSASAGAAIGSLFNKGVEKAAPHIKQFFNQATDKYATATRGSKYSNLSESRNLAVESYDKVRNIAEWIRQGRYQALKNLDDPADKIRVGELMENLKTEFLRRRQIMEKKVLKVGPEHPAYNRVMNRFNTKIQNQMMDDYLPALLEKEKDDIAQAVIAWGEHNDNVIKKLNEQAFGLVRGLPDESGKGLVGIRWHIDDIYKKKDHAKAGDMLGRFQIHKAQSLDRSTAPIDMAVERYIQMTGKKVSVDEFMNLAKTDKNAQKILSDARDISYGAYTEDFAKKFLDESETKAVQLMNEYKNAKPFQKPIEYLENGLKAYDKITNWAKANMLYFSTSWLKNNYFDNLAKSYMESGLQGVMDAATFGKFHKGVAQDVKDLYANKLNRIYTADDMQDALHRGVLDNPMFKSLDDRVSREFMFTPEKIKASEAKDPLSLLSRAADAWLNNGFVRKVAGFGSHMEGTARMMTYIRVKEALEASPLFKNASKEDLAKIKDIAAETVKKTFFDYGDVTHFENAVFKRFVPFYSFYSKNLPYWMKNAFDPEKVGRLVALEKVRRNIGDDPSEYEKQGLTPYLIAGGARKLSRGDGETTYGIYPSGSMYDAANMINPMQWMDQLKDKGHTGIKAAYEILSGNDLFDGQPLYPSDTKDGKKFLFARGHKYKALGVPGVEVDAKGNPYATSDDLVLIDKVLSTLWPHGLIDQVAGSVGKVQHRKETPFEAVRNRLLSPMQTVKVSDQYARQVRVRKGEGQ